MRAKARPNPILEPSLRTTYKPKGFLPAVVAQIAIAPVKYKVSKIQLNKSANGESEAIQNAKLNKSASAASGGNQYAIIDSPEIKGQAIEKTITNKMESIT